MNVELILFFSLALIAILTALGLLLSKNTIYAALYLVLNFFTIAIFFLLLHGPFIAMAQITVYAGAIMVLFLFVIMLLGTKELEKSKALPWQRPVAILLGVILLVEAGYILFFRTAPAQNAASLAKDFGSPTGIGNLLFQNYLLPFEITSVLLLVAMVGAIILAHKEKTNKEQPKE